LLSPLAFFTHPVAQTSSTSAHDAWKKRMQELKDRKDREAKQQHDEFTAEKEKQEIIFTNCVRRGIDTALDEGVSCEYSFYSVALKQDCDIGTFNARAIVKRELENNGFESDGVVRDYQATGQITLKSFVEFWLKSKQ
jgi:hypothetical protein